MRSVLLLRLRKVAVTNMPIFMKPGLRTWMRTLAVRMLGSRIGSISLMRPLTMLLGKPAKWICGVLADGERWRLVILIHIADDPDIVEVRDGEEIR